MFTELVHFVRTKVLCFHFDYFIFLYNASNLMLNKIPYAKLSSPTTLENGIIQGFHLKEELPKSSWMPPEMVERWISVINWFVLARSNEQFSTMLEKSPIIKHQEAGRPPGIHPTLPSNFIRVWSQQCLRTPGRCEEGASVWAVPLTHRCRSQTFSDEGWTVLADKVNTFPSWFESWWTASWIFTTSEDPPAN